MLPSFAVRCLSRYCSTRVRCHFPACGKVGAPAYCWTRGLDRGSIKGNAQAGFPTWARARRPLEAVLAHRNRDGVSMVINTLMAQRARCKGPRVTRGRFLSALSASHGRGVLPLLRATPLRESSHNTSYTYVWPAVQIWPLAWSNLILDAFRSDFADAPLPGGEEAPAVRSGLAAAALSKRARHPARSRRAARAVGRRGPTEALIEGLRRRARASTLDGHDRERARDAARAPSRARRARASSPTRRVSALRMVGTRRFEWALPALREGARCA